MIINNQNFYSFKELEDKLSCTRPRVKRIIGYLHIDLIQISHPKNGVKTNYVSEQNLGRIMAFYNENKDNLTSILRNDTLSNKYGSVENAYSVFSEKSKQTNIKKYGIEYFTQSDEFAKKQRDGRIKNHGSWEQYQEDLKSSLKETNQRQYDCDWYFSTDDFKNKSKNTLVEKYGVDNAFKSTVIQDKIKQINLEKYGKEHFTNRDKCSQTWVKKSKDEIKSIDEKRKQTKLEKYGNENYFNYEKSKETCLEKYGEIHYSKTQEFKNSVSNKAKVYMNTKYDEFEKQNNCKHLSHIDLNRHHDWSTLRLIMKSIDSEFLFDSEHNYYVKNEDLSRFVDEVSKIKNGRASISEKQVADFVKSIYNGDVVENNHSVLDGKELDIYIPSKNVAIEFDGLYWHSSKEDSDYRPYINLQLYKTEICEQKEIRLIHIFEDEWLNKQEICKSIIASSLGIYKEKYFARKCECRKITHSMAKSFINDNHIQGGSNFGKDCYGLFYNNELLQVATIRDNFAERKIKSIELGRMCTKLNTQVVGGFSKLIKFAMNDLHRNEMTSFVDRRLFDGKGYNSSGWVIIGKSEPRYFYINNGVRENRQIYMKQSCLKKWYDGKDVGKTEWEMCHEHGLPRIYDCGTIKVRYSSC